jgi:hypothetical protein
VNLDVTSIIDRLQDHRCQCEHARDEHWMNEPPRDSACGHPDGCPCDAFVLSELVVALDEQPRQTCLECDGAGGGDWADHPTSMDIAGNLSFWDFCAECKGERTVPLETIPRADLTVRQVGINSSTPDDADWVPFDVLAAVDPRLMWEHVDPEFRRSHRVGEATGGRCHRVVGDANDLPGSPACVELRGEWGLDGVPFWRELTLWPLGEDEEGTDVSHWLEQVPDLKPGQWVAVFERWELEP